MADYVIISTPFGNIPIAADEVGTNWHQRLKMQFGADGVATDVSETDPMPVAAGNVAHDAADSGNPVKIGGKAANSTPAAVSAGDRVNAWLDLNGRLVVNVAGIVTTGQATKSNSFPVVLASD